MFTYGSLRRYIPFRIRNRRNRTRFLHISRYLGPYSPLWAFIESRNRFDCPSFLSIWHSLFGKSNLPSSSSCWEDFFLDVANRLKGKSLRDLIVKLILAAGVYLIWKEKIFFRFGEHLGLNFCFGWLPLRGRRGRRLTDEPGSNRMRLTL